MKCCTDKPKIKFQKAKRLLFGLWFLVFAMPLQACPLCSEAIAKVSGLARGFGWSIALMLGTAAGVVLTISSIIFIAYRRAETHHPESQS
jgi:hypothetical protein